MAPSSTSRVLRDLSGSSGHATSLDERLASFADGRHAVVTTDELLRAGYTRRRIQGLAARGTLHPQYPGVHAVGLPTLTPKGRALAAVLAVGTAGRPKRTDGAPDATARPAIGAAMDTGAAGRTGAALQGLTTWWPPTPTVATARAVRGPRACGCSDPPGCRRPI